MSNDRLTPKPYETWLKQLLRLRFEQADFKVENEVLKIMALKPETIKRYVEALGREKILATFTKEDHLAALRKEDLLAALSQEDVLQHFLAKLGPEQLRQMIDQMSHNKSESH